MPVSRPKDLSPRQTPATPPVTKKSQAPVTGEVEKLRFLYQQNPSLQWPLDLSTQTFITAER